MTEQEWLQATDPQPMLEFLRGKASERKQRLFAVACCRHFWADTTSSDRMAIEVAEMFADGRTDEYRLALARRNLERGDTQNVFVGYHALLAAVCLGPDLRVNEVSESLLAASYWTGPDDYDRSSINARYAARETERARQVSTSRCVFGNPFRPVTLDPTWLSWHDGLVVSMARQMYESRDFRDMPVLADALEESSCTNPDILGHCRQPAEHVRGCWVVDLLLGKE
jgi:hypothetical protein